MTEDRHSPWTMVAKWMADKLAADGILYQADAVDHITTAFGPQFLKGNSINPERARPIRDPGSGVGVPSEI